MMKIKLLLAAAAFGVASLGLGTASAMPLSGLATAASEIADVQQVRWVCGPYRCFWRSGYGRFYGHYAWGGPRYYARPWWGGRFYGHRPWRGGFYGRSWWGGGY